MITVVATYTPEGDTPQDRLEGPPSEAAMATIRSVEDQTWPHELVIIRNMGYPLEDMQRFGVEQATTEWVTFINEGTVWGADHLEKIFSIDPGCANVIMENGTVVAVQREFYLTSWHHYAGVLDLSDVASPPASGTALFTETFENEGPSGGVPRGSAAVSGYPLNVYRRPPLYPRIFLVL